MSTIWIIWHQFQSYEYYLDCAKITNQSHEFYLECAFFTNQRREFYLDQLFYSALKSNNYWARTAYLPLFWPICYSVGTHKPPAPVHADLKSLQLYWHLTPFTLIWPLPQTRPCFSSTPLWLFGGSGAGACSNQNFYICIGNIFSLRKLLKLC